MMQDLHRLKLIRLALARLQADDWTATHCVEGLNGLPEPYYDCRPDIVLIKDQKMAVVIAVSSPMLNDFLRERLEKIGFTSNLLKVIVIVQRRDYRLLLQLYKRWKNVQIDTFLVSDM